MYIKYVLNLTNKKNGRAALGDVDTRNSVEY